MTRQERRRVFTLAHHAGVAMYCTQCGMEISDDVRFCTACGAPVEAVPPTAADDTPGVNPSEQMVSPVEPPDQIARVTTERPSSTRNALLVSLLCVAFACIVLCVTMVASAQRRKQEVINSLDGVIDTDGTLPDVTVGLDGSLRSMTGTFHKGAVRSVESARKAVLQVAPTLGYRTKTPQLDYVGEKPGKTEDTVIYYFKANPPEETTSGKAPDEESYVAVTMDDEGNAVGLEVDDKVPTDVQKADGGDVKQADDKKDADKDLQQPDDDRKGKSSSGSTDETVKAGKVEEEVGRDTGGNQGGGDLGTRRVADPSLSAAAQSTEVALPVVCELASASGTERVTGSYKDGQLVQKKVETTDSANGGASKRTVTTDYAYNDKGELTTVTIERTAEGDAPTQGASWVWHVDYDADGSHMRAHIKNKDDEASQQVGSIEESYDKDGRMSSRRYQLPMSEVTGDGSLDSIYAAEETYAYNDEGLPSRIEVKVDKDGIATAREKLARVSFECSYGEGMRLTSVVAKTYDDTDKQQRELTYEFDEHGNITRVLSASLEAGYRLVEEYGYSQDRVPTSLDSHSEQDGQQGKTELDLAKVDDLSYKASSNGAAWTVSYERVKVNESALPRTPVSLAQPVLPTRYSDLWLASLDGYDKGYALHERIVSQLWASNLATILQVTE